MVNNLKLCKTHSIYVERISIKILCRVFTPFLYFTQKCIVNYLLQFILNSLLKFLKKGFLVDYLQCKNLAEQYF